MEAGALGAEWGAWLWPRGRRYALEGLDWAVERRLARKASVVFGVGSVGTQCLLATAAAAHVVPAVIEAGSSVITPHYDGAVEVAGRVGVKRRLVVQQVALRSRAPPCRRETAAPGGATTAALWEEGCAVLCNVSGGLGGCHASREIVRR